VSSSYVYDQAWQQERDRLRALEDLFQEATTRRLADLGVREGWRCLEVGCGAGAVALWLADRVGSGGHVLATDLDPRFLEGHGRDNLEVRQHDILVDALDAGRFDVVHARAVLEHIPQAPRALARMIDAVRPGGWVMIEDTDGDPAALARYIHPPEQAGLYERLGRATVAIFAAVGVDPNFGARLPQVLVDAGLTNVRAEIHAPLVQGGSERDWVRLSVEHLRPHLIRTGLITEPEVDQFLALTHEPAFRYLPLFMVTAWGQRPSL
jgi:SAM-dependent methyltransferase